MPQRCDNCGSDDIYLKAMIMTNGAICVQVRCKDCGHSRMLAKEENIKKRTNNELDKWARAVKKRDQNKCVICGSIRDLEAHHIIPVSHNESYKYIVPNGITLCSKCHWYVHNKMLPL